MAKPECPYTRFCEKAVGKCDRQMGMSETKRGKLSKAYSFGFSWSPSLLEIKMFVPSEDREGSSTPGSSPCFRERSASPCHTYCFTISFSLKYSTWYHICSELRHCKANMLIILGTLEWFCEKQASGILWHK